MPYCSPNASFTSVWIDGGFNHCFIDSIKALALAFTMGICGFLELRMYIRYGTKVDQRLLTPVPKMYILQMCLSLVVLLIQPSRLVVQLFDPPLFGYSIVLNLIGTVVWSLSIALVFIERNYDLPVAPARGHSLSLLIFWLAAFLCDSLELINVKSPNWWFHVTKRLDLSLLLLWLVQYLCELCLCIVGCTAPGIVPISIRNQFIYRHMDNEKQLNHYGSVAAEGNSPTFPEEASVEFVESMQEMKKGLSNGELVVKFSEIPRMVKIEDENNVKLSTCYAKNAGNDKLNRYCNVLPFDHNRVILKTQYSVNNCQYTTPVRVADSDYINASHVNMKIARLGLVNKFICSQGPKPETLSHFWRMIYEQNVNCIVMLTGLIEGKVKKCEQYYPDTIGKVLELDNGDISITCSDVSTPSKSYTIRQFMVLYKLPSNDKNDAQLVVTRHMSHFQYIGWPDHGAPKQTNKVLRFWHSVREKYLENHQPTSPNLPPLLVHCSAGIGRTGVYILLDTLIIQMEADLAVKPLIIVKQMRQQRMGMVQTEDQFVFACRAALDHYEGNWRKAIF